ncbi:MAG: hypothetical protein M1818_007198 [Claussenomyces sp. TS43310]|nr:MAG: hypothetical protein M1818_007198 [Claussenomyces sp. TS43310]
MGFVNASGTVVYKRQNGHTTKDALVERWRHNQRNPMDLEAFSGVEVSLCTRNARRLLHILKCQTMCNYLRGMSFQWNSEEGESAYFAALKCPKTFRRFWKSHPEWRGVVGDAISQCMDALEETGINDDNCELSALLVESFDNEGDSDGESDGECNRVASVRFAAQGSNSVSRYLPVEDWIVTLFRSEHTWSRFLEDSEETLTMAIVGATCLDFEDTKGVGRRCSQPRRHREAGSRYTGFPVLQTSLQLNASILKKDFLPYSKIEKGNRIKWNADELKKGTKFSLGNQGMLKVVSSSTRCCPAIMEWSPARCELLAEVKDAGVNQLLLGKNVARHHKEYIRGKWEADPLPILVLSKSTKPLFIRS